MHDDQYASHDGVEKPPVNMERLGQTERSAELSSGKPAHTKHFNCLRLGLPLRNTNIELSKIDRIRTEYNRQYKLNFKNKLLPL